MTDRGSGAGLTVSVVLPCLNEAETVAGCVARAREALTNSGLNGEVVVADNGSTDGSQAIAREAGARVVDVAARGYGSALMAGIDAAQGRYVVMGDADGSYDFGETPKFVAKLDAGCDLVQGCRLPAGGGRVMPGAMPWLHRWWGNPMFSWLVRTWFGAKIHDVHCGLRAFRRDLIPRLDLQCTGMEFASEMIIKATLYRAKIDEVPITLWPDKRITRKPHLRTFRDGWRHLRFYMLFSPRWLFLVPGLALIVAGAFAAIAGYENFHFGPARVDVHTLLFGSLMVIVGYQAVIFAILTKAFAINAGLLPPDPRVRRFAQAFSLERGLVTGTVLVALGLWLVIATLATWAEHGFGALDSTRTLRLAIPGVLATVLGLQTVLFVFFAGVLELDRRKPTPSR